MQNRHQIKIKACKAYEVTNQKIVPKLEWTLVTNTPHQSIIAVASFSRRN
jgi:hypothetical protein